MTREDILEHVLATYDFGEDIIVTGVGKWNREEPDHYTCVLSVDIEPVEEVEEMEEPTYVSFHVRFEPDTTSLEDVYALLGSTGDDIGQPGHDISYNSAVI